jgi:hypothetical protein
MAGLDQMVERVRGRLDQYVTNRPQLATFGGLTGANMSLTPVQGYNAMGGSALVEIGSELIQISSFDSASNTAVVPAWGRAQLGTSQVTLTTGTKAIINPLWPYWHVAQELINGMRKLYPDLSAVKNTTLTTEIYQEKYELPADLEDILDIRIEWFTPQHPQRPISRYTVDVSNADGKKYLHIPSYAVSGRPIYITYRAQPTLPTDPADTSWTWVTSGLPLTAEDLPILYAQSTLILGAETAKIQTYSSEQSDRNRFVQAGAANAVSRRIEEVFEKRFSEERRKFRDLYPIRVVREFNR